MVKWNVPKLLKKFQIVLDFILGIHTMVATMKRRITISFEIDPKDYHLAKNSKNGAVEVAKAILNHEADFPIGEVAMIDCGGLIKYWPSKD